ncbi:succinylglutamate desuccinylase/aspartoacylase family protein [Neptunicoccus sediminis]|uniref:succinylglutamate desuccinylase/aspartoacylase family protein n=1 Tax=Neptunicoccus sediminis TaxID=1892596 RepID=UPI000845C5D9|nr:succinylglutamate desuccinylase/aspartoacylase family protein [Neptunicoccus sediminis]
MKQKKRADFELGGVAVAAGSRRTIDIPVSVLADHTPVSLSAHVIHGAKDGPTVFASAGVHGDEVIGVEILRRLLQFEGLNRLRGTLIVVPIVNTYGFLMRSRYLPDRRDLNRSFPGTSKGSLASRLAHIFLEDLVSRCDLGIDLHSAAIHRTNLPQIRVSKGSERLMELAQVFGPPVILTSGLREGSLRQAAQEKGVEVLLYEAGEGLRFDEMAVRAGVAGILRVLRHLDMVAAKGIAKPKEQPIFCAGSSWVRAPAGGLIRIFKGDGDVVEEGETLAVVSDPFGEAEAELRAPMSGVIIGRAVLPVVNEGDAIFHIASVSSTQDTEDTVEGLAQQLELDPLFDEDEII